MGPPRIRPILEKPRIWGFLVPKTLLRGVLDRFHTNPYLGQKSGTETGPLRGPVFVRDLSPKEGFVWKRSRTPGSRVLAPGTPKI